MPKSVKLGKKLPVSFFLFDKSYRQFHQHLTSSFCNNIFAAKKFKSKLWLDKSCPKHFHTKNLRVKCWWNWNLVSISSTLNVQIFCRFCSFYYVHVTREKLPKWSLYEKFVHLTLMKLTPTLHIHFFWLTGNLDYENLNSLDMTLRLVFKLCSN